MTKAHRHIRLTGKGEPRFLLRAFLTFLDLSLFLPLPSPNGKDLFEDEEVEKQGC